jgi:hypothetical protein
VENVTIRLSEQEFPRAVIRSIVDDEKPFDAENAVVLETIGQSLRFVAHDHECRVTTGGRCDRPAVDLPEGAHSGLASSRLWDVSECFASRAKK